MRSVTEALTYEFLKMHYVWEFEPIPQLVIDEEISEEAKPKSRTGNHNIFDCVNMWDVVRKERDSFFISKTLF